MRDKTVLVTGGAGFIGSCFVRRAVAGDARVVTLDALTYAGSRSTLAAVEGDDRHEFVHGSINDRPLVARLLDEHRPDWVVNFAAESHVDRSIDGPGAFVATNITGVFELLEAVRFHLAAGSAADGFRFLQVSTDEVYGSLPDGRADEDSALLPNSPYAASKAAADHLVRAYKQTYGVPVLITRSSNNYGPYQFPEKFIPLLIAKALQDESLPLYGDGLQARDWLHVEDNCAAIQTVLEKGHIGAVYNVATGTEITNADLAARLCAALEELRPADPPYASRIAHVADRPGHDRRYALDVTRIASSLGWSAATDLDAGLTDTVRWYLDNEPWWRMSRDKGYAGERLGLRAGGSV